LAEVLGSSLSLGSCSGGNSCLRARRAGLLNGLNLLADFLDLLVQGLLGLLLDCHTATDEGLKEGTDSSGLLNLVLQVGSEGGISGSGHVALDDRGRERVIGFEVALKILDDFDGDCVGVGLHGGVGVGLVVTAG